MNGHAEYDKYGKDIVCSAASSIIVGGINAIAEFGYLNKISYQVKSGKARLKVLNHDDQLDIIIKTIYYQLITIQESYPDYIQIQEV